MAPRNPRNEPAAPTPAANAPLLGMASSGAMRAAIGTKIDTNLVPYEGIVAAAMAFNYGALKYQAHNYRKGLSFTNLLESLKRHAHALELGEEIDLDSGLPHYAMIAANAMMLAHNVMQGVVIDDRPVFDFLSEHSIDEIARRAKSLEMSAEVYRHARADIAAPVSAR